ncbi:MAG: TIM barrel protein [Candidatus Aenigmarchaeota archaeon]|nr:TIM barrel protein [Candidatus Aenigmarchaeota archaeon]
MSISLGPAGSPARSTLEGIPQVKKLGLQAMEVEFVRGVRMSPGLAQQVGEAAAAHGIALSVHAPYYINLASHNSATVAASRRHILDSCERAHLMGASTVVFHPGCYGTHSPEDTYELIRHEILGLLDAIRDLSWDVALAPEVMGRLSQFGSFDDVLRLSKDTHCSLCIDVCHVYARNLGTIDYQRLFEGLTSLKRTAFHFHFSGVTYGPRGERSHETLERAGPAFEGFARRLLESGFGATVISESPVTWEDSLVMKAVLERLGYKF